MIEGKVQVYLVFQGEIHTVCEQGITLFVCNINNHLETQSNINETPSLNTS